MAAIGGPNVGSEGNVGFENVNRGRTTYVCPSLTPSGNVEASGCEVSFHKCDELIRLCEKS